MRKIDELLNNVDAMSICVPTKYHLDIAKKVIEKNVHCLIEKPLTPTPLEGEDLLCILKDTNKNLIV